MAKRKVPEKSAKKPKKRPKYNLKSRITSALRRIWFYGPQRKVAAKLAKERGNTCAQCNIPNDKLQIDHLVPVVPTDGQPYDWQTYIDRLFCPPEGLRAICKECHAVFTAVSAQQRKDNKK